MSADLTDELLRELRYTLPDDRADRVRLAEDCLRLHEVLPEDYPLVRRTHWYRSLWETLGQLRLWEAADACRGVVQARDLLLEVLRILVMNSPHGSELLEEIEEGLAFRESRHGRLEGPLHALAVHVRRLRDHLGWRGTFEEDERNLPDSLKVLILRSMINAAWADGELRAPEVRLLNRKIQALALPQRAGRELLEEIRSPRPLDRDLRDIQDYPLRLLLYRNIAAMTVADGEISLKENLLLGHFAKELRIEPQDAQAVERELYSLSRGGLDSLLRGAGQTEPPPRPNAPGEGPRRGPRDRALLAEAAELWTRTLRHGAKLLSWQVVQRLLLRLEAASRDPGREEGLTLLDPEATRKDLELILEEASAECGGRIDQLLAEGLPGFDEIPDLHWARTAGPHLGELMRGVLDPVIDSLRAVELAGRELEELQENPLEHLRRRGLIPFVSDPRNRSARLFLVPDSRELRRQVQQQEEETLEGYSTSLRAVLTRAEALRQHLAANVTEAGQAYLEHVLEPLFEGMLEHPELIRRFLAVLAREGQNPDPRP